MWTRGKKHFAVCRAATARLQDLHIYEVTSGPTWPIHSDLQPLAARVKNILQLTPQIISGRGGPTSLPILSGGTVAQLPRRTSTNIRVTRDSTWRDRRDLSCGWIPPSAVMSPGTQRRKPGLCFSKTRARSRSVCKTERRPIWRSRGRWRIWTRCIGFGSTG